MDSSGNQTAGFVGQADQPAGAGTLESSSSSYLQINKNINSNLDNSSNNNVNNQNININHNQLSSSSGRTITAPVRQPSIPIPNTLLSTINAARQRQPMCGECEKSLPNQIVFDKVRRGRKRGLRGAYFINY